MVLPPEKARCGHFASWTYFQGGKERCIGCERDALRSEVERFESVYAIVCEEVREATSRAEIAEAEVERLREDLGRLSVELGLPPAYGPADGELARFVALWKESISKAEQRAGRLERALREVRSWLWNNGFGNTKPWLIAEKALEADGAGGRGR